MKDHNKFQHTILMLLFCLLPLFVFFILVINGVELNPMLFFLFIVICCLAMFYFMRQTHTQTETEISEENQDIKNENVKGIIPVPDHLGDVFQANYIERVDDTLIYTGNLLTDADSAYQKLKESSDKIGVTALLQEDDAGNTLVLVSKKLFPGAVTHTGMHHSGQPISTNEVSGEAKPSKPTVNLILFILTFITTTYAGALQQGINLLKEPDKFNVGLPYGIALMVILGAHELGHYFAAKHHKMNVTLPYFIPVPFALGTFGAFIRLKSPSENRKALFDVGVAGPIAGLVFAIPALIIGLQSSKIIPMSNENVMMGGADVGSSILLALLAKISVGKDLISGHTFQFSPLAFAGWLGLFVTALNLLPIGQLDGGHIAHALFGRKNANTIGMVALFSLFLLGLFVWSGLLTWAIIVFFLAGIKSAPPLNDVTKLDGKRVAIGLIAFIILFMILVPVPHSFYQTLGINCPYV
ncbi:MAG: site-2 protease family protein [Ignavibacterium sp.]|jgi:membrane-associated protease RseP (regulator of RpoE activity)|nr:MAG: site-2 protease family protein [Ignavibacterium sp.]MDD5608732.1 site-2 protease family protein [Ignavibacterium sp.]